MKDRDTDHSEMDSGRRADRQTGRQTEKHRQDDISVYSFLVYKLAEWNSLILYVYIGSEIGLYLTLGSMSSGGGDGWGGGGEKAGEGMNPGGYLDLAVCPHFLPQPLYHWSR